MTAAVIDPVKLAQLAEVAVNVGLNLQPGQDLILTAPMAALPLVRLVAAAAYRAGAGVVTPIFSDDDITLARYANAEIHNIASIVGGVSSQEAVKIITGQYVPFNNTYIYNGIASTGGVYQL